MKKIIFAITVILLISIPIHAYEFQPNDDVRINLRGQIFVDFFYNYGIGHNGNKPNVSDGMLLHKITDKNYEEANSFGVENFFSSNLGVDVNYKDIIGATIEFGVTSEEVLRRAFMEIYIGENINHSILIGKEGSVAAYCFGQVARDDLALNNYGTLAYYRKFQIQYRHNGFQLAIILPTTLNHIDYPDGGMREEVYRNFKGKFNNRLEKNNSFKFFNSIPRLELAYNLFLEDGSDFKIFAGYGAYVYEVNDTGIEGLPLEIIGKKGINHSFNLGVGGTEHFGYTFLNYTAFFGQNLHLTDSHLIGTEFMYVNNNFGKNGNYSLDDIHFETYSAGGAIGFGHTFAEKYTLQAGIGYVANFGPGYSQQDDRLSAYLNTIIQVNDWYSIIPEISYFDELIGPSADGSSYGKQGSSLSVGFVNKLEF